MKLGDKIRLIRNERTISIRKLSELTGLSKSTLSDIENSVSKKPTIDTVGKIARALEVSISELLDGNEGETPDIKTSIPASEIKDDIESSIRFLRSVARAKNHPKETQDKIADFIELILKQEENNM
jgi:transcriptional regulator with XRE-family HTH domain